MAKPNQMNRIHYHIRTLIRFPIPSQIREEKIGLHPKLINQLITNHKTSQYNIANRPHTYSNRYAHINPNAISIIKNNHHLKLPNFSRNCTHCKVHDLISWARSPLKSLTSLSWPVGFPCMQCYALNYVDQVETGNTIGENVLLFTRDDSLVDEIQVT